MTEKIKVVWLCHFSNEEVHSKLNLGVGGLRKIASVICGKKLKTEVPDFGVWISNGIKEFEHFDSVELHVVSPYPYLYHKKQELTLNGVHYHFFQNEDESLFQLLINKFLPIRAHKYKKNRRRISRIVSDVRPEIIHLFGAENPYYSLCVFDMPSTVPIIVQLQTLLSDKEFQDRVGGQSLLLRSEYERKVLLRADYIGTTALKFRNIIKKEIKPDAIFLNTSFALTETIHVDSASKTFDFVYFASNISKAVDLALEAFVLAYRQNPNITLDIIGGFDTLYKVQLDDFIRNHGIEKSVVFEGKLATHDDVLAQIRKSRFALLPLRIDLTSGTIREAMANGLPVLTTDTGELGTRKLNGKRLNVLISPIEDHKAMADNMIKLLNDESLSKTLKQNGYITTTERSSNEKIMLKYVQAYRACNEHFSKGVEIPKELTEM